VKQATFEATADDKPKPRVETKLTTPLDTEFVDDEEELVDEQLNLEV